MCINSSLPQLSKEFPAFLKITPNPTPFMIMTFHKKFINQPNRLLLYQVRNDLEFSALYIHFDYYHVFQFEVRLEVFSKINCLHKQLLSVNMCW
mmetsp:Transcript_74469/g.125410  ORF Transcript_74469/g.125410 Transcript_74469/m.125410 type:complete len:94 (-) Transcript_74469:767-1048(-)